MTGRRRIDVHHHVLPGKYVSGLARIGERDDALALLPRLRSRVAGAADA